MRVILCVKDAKKNYRVTAYGNLDIPNDGNLGEYLQKVLSFTIEQEFADLRPFAKYSPTGIVSTTERREFYEFEVVSGDASNTGHLRILGLAEDQECLPADAP